MANAQEVMNRMPAHLEARQYPLKIVPRFLMGLLWLLASIVAIVTVTKGPFLQGGRAGDAFGYIATFIGSLTMGGFMIMYFAKYFYHLVTIKGPVLALNSVGFRDFRVSQSLCPWGAISHMRVSRKSRAIDLILRPGAGQSLGLRRDRLTIETVGLSLSPKVIEKEFIVWLNGAKP